MGPNQFECNFGESLSGLGLILLRSRRSLGGFGLILIQFRGVLGWVRMNFNAISGSPKVGWD